jgi:hypothetical protein
MFNQHLAVKCKFGNCLNFTGMHCDILHIDVNEKPSDINPNFEGISGDTLLTSFATTRTNSDLNCNTLLSTALTNVKDADGKLHNCHALLDADSQLPFVIEDMAERLNLKLSKCLIPVTGINNVTARFVAHTCEVKLCFKICNFHTTVNCAVIREITSNLIAQPIDCRDWKLPEDIQLADPSFNTPTKVNVLLGADVF